MRVGVERMRGSEGVREKSPKGFFFLIFFSFY